MIWIELLTVPLGSIVGAKDADVATLEVPNNDPVNPLVAIADPVIISDPVTINDPDTSNPFENNAYPAKYDAVAANGVNEAVTAYEEVIVLDELGAKELLNAYELVRA